MYEIYICIHVYENNFGVASMIFQSLIFTYIYVNVHVKQFVFSLYIHACSNDSQSGKLLWHVL